MSDPHSRRRFEQGIIADADQAEYAAIIHGSTVVDSGVFDDKVADALDDFTPLDGDAQARWHVQDLQFDTAVGSIHEEIERRKSIMGDSYPFQLNNNQIAYTQSQSRFYEFCLAICTAPNITTGEFVKFPRFFERVTAILVQHYFGCYTNHLHVGAPRDPSVGKTFEKAMRTLHDLTEEWIWAPNPGMPTAPPSSGDEGIDFVVWKETLDGRRGKLFILGQCACGDDWNQKLNDIDLNKLGRWFNPMSFVSPPVRAFITPRHLSNGHLDVALNQAGMVFDRARLTLIAEQITGNDAYTPWVHKMKSLSEKVIKSPAASSKKG